MANLESGSSTTTALWMYADSQATAPPLPATKDESVELGDGQYCTVFQSSPQDDLSVLRRVMQKTLGSGPSEASGIRTLADLGILYRFKGSTLWTQASPPSGLRVETLVFGTNAPAADYPQLRTSLIGSGVDDRTEIPVFDAPRKTVQSHVASGRYDGTSPWRPIDVTYVSPRTDYRLAPLYDGFTHRATAALAEDEAGVTAADFRVPDPGTVDLHYYGSSGTPVGNHGGPALPAGLHWHTGFVALDGEVSSDPWEHLWDLCRGAGFVFPSADEAVAYFHGRTAANSAWSGYDAWVPCLSRGAREAGRLEELRNASQPPDPVYRDWVCIGQLHVGAQASFSGAAGLTMRDSGQFFAKNPQFTPYPDPSHPNHGDPYPTGGYFSFLGSIGEYNSRHFDGSAGLRPGVKAGYWKWSMPALAGTRTLPKMSLRLRGGGNLMSGDSLAYASSNHMLLQPYVQFPESLVLSHSIFQLQYRVSKVAAATDRAGFFAGGAAAVASAPREVVQDWIPFTRGAHVDMREMPVGFAPPSYMNPQNMTSSIRHWKVWPSSPVDGYAWYGSGDDTGTVTLTLSPGTREVVIAVPSRGEGVYLVDVRVVCPLSDWDPSYGNTDIDTVFGTASEYMWVADSGKQDPVVAADPLAPADTFYTHRGGTLDRCTYFIGGRAARGARGSSSTCWTTSTSRRGSRANSSGASGEPPALEPVRVRTASGDIVESVRHRAPLVRGTTSAWPLRCHGDFLNYYRHWRRTAVAEPGTESRVTYQWWSKSTSSDLDVVGGRVPPLSLVSFASSANKSGLYHFPRQSLMRLVDSRFPLRASHGGDLLGHGNESWAPFLNVNALDLTQRLLGSRRLDYAGLGGDPYLCQFLGGNTAHANVGAYSTWTASIPAAGLNTYVHGSASAIGIGNSPYNPICLTKYDASVFADSTAGSTSGTGTLRGDYSDGAVCEAYTGDATSPVGIYALYSGGALLGGIQAVVTRNTFAAHGRLRHERQGQIRHHLP